MTPTELTGLDADCDVYAVAENERRRLRWKLIDRFWCRQHGHRAWLVIDKIICSRCWRNLGNVKEDAAHRWLDARKERG